MYIEKERPFYLPLFFESVCPLNVFDCDCLRLGGQLGYRPANIGESNFIRFDSAIPYAQPRKRIVPLPGLLFDIILCRQLRSTACALQRKRRRTRCRKTRRQGQIPIYDLPASTSNPSRIFSKILDSNLETCTCETWRTRATSLCVLSRK